MGVFRGDFAVHINRAFSDRRLYLFDTFKGFVQEEIDADVKAGLASHQQFTSDVREVMDALPYKEKAGLSSGNSTGIPCARSLKTNVSCS